MRPEMTLSIGELSMILGGLMALIGAVVTLVSWINRQQVKTAILEAMKEVQGEMSQYVTKEACKSIHEDCRRLHQQEIDSVKHEVSALAGAKPAHR